MAIEASSLGDHTPRGVAVVNTRGNKAPEISVKGAGGAIFTSFIAIGPSYRTEIRKKSSTRGGDSTSRAEVRAIPLTIKKQRMDASINSKNKTAQKIQREISYLKSNCKKLEENRSASKESDEPQDNVGDQFGDRTVKNQQKRSN